MRMRLHHLSFLLFPLAVSFLALPAHASAFRFVLDQKNLSASQISATQALLAQATALLPKTLKARLDGAIPVQFVPTAEDVLGLTQKAKKEINLSRNLLPEIEKQLPAISANRALATILHETAHLYDNTRQFSPEEEEFLRQCETRRPAPPLCQQLKEARFLSSRTDFRTVSGWYGKNQTFTVRSVDPEEARNPRETFAVNMEHFLLDPDFACRKPSLARYFSQHFHWQPFPHQCSLTAAYVNSSAASPQDVLSSLPLDRVYEIDYLLAGPGSGLDSRFGHTMYRLVICPPGKAMSADCRKDISSHLVLSFRASVTDFQTSALKGIFGSYPSRLFVLPLTQVIQEYASSELRDLQAIPLRLTSLEKQEFLERALEYHWNYNGKYYFLTNNCADEALHLLASSLLRPDLLSMSVATPKGLYNKLNQLNLLDTAPLLDKTQAIRDGLFFESYQARFQLAFAKIQATTGRSYDMKAWGQLSSDERLAVFNEALSRITLAQNKKALAAAFFILESAIQKATENNYLNAVALKILKGQEHQRSNTPSAGNSIAEDARAYLFLNSQLTNPSALLVGQKGYGLPSAAELSATASKFAELGKKYQDTQNDLIASVKTLFEPELLEELQQIRKNLKFYLQQITTQPSTKGNRS